ncbi:MAG: ABC transporter ATP-binding protein [Chloroflexota bacterium]|nr:ABC transporter ATP-binding protein [Chloroflexota bacterium]MDE2839690.1 ABC transporter ATP-binding protein [Chloroflexota bacterium]
MSNRERQASGSPSAESGDSRKPPIGPLDDGEDILGEFDLKILARLLGYTAGFRLQIAGAVAVTLVNTAASILRPYLLKLAIDGPLTTGDLRGLDIIVILYLCAGILLFGAIGARQWIISWLGQQLLFALRQGLFQHLQRLSLGFYDRNRAGRIITRVTSDVRDISRLVTDGIVNTSSDLFVLVGILFVMLYMHWQLALLTFIVFPGLIAVVFFFKGKSRSAWRVSREDRSVMNGYFAESILGVRVTQAFTRQAENLRRFTDLSDRYVGSTLKANGLSAAFSPTVSIINAAAIMIIIWFGGVAVVQGTVTLGIMVAFLTYVQRFFQPLQSMSSRFNQMQSAMAASERVFALLDQEPDIREVPDAKPLPAVRGHVKFEDVVFEYTAHTPVLHGISLDAQPGELIAIVGHTGAGKTSIINVLCRFYDIRSGKVTIDGHSIGGVTIDSLREQIGLVLQEPFLFSGTVKENIRYGRLDATDEEIVAAAKAVRLHDFVEAQPFRYETLVGERGTQLSIGQRQLLSFARALLADPRILVLDEATSSVDTETEQQIQEALALLMRGRTSFVIAHRLSTIQNADQVIVMDRGKIIEQGTHEELLRQRGDYFQLYTMQFADQE